MCGIEAIVNRGKKRIWGAALDNFVVSDDVVVVSGEIMLVRSRQTRALASYS